MKLEPIAVIGIGCRFPGGVENPETFWQLLRDGIDAITEVPPSRWDVSQYYDPDATQPGKTNTRWGGFLPQIDRFDPQFFGIAPREAITMDPQQRLLLEVAWEALEDAGQVPDRLRGSQTGVFIGIGTHDYSIRLWQHPVNDPYATTGTGNCIAANRISYLFDFKGPSLAIDTACSSSLVAVHLACQSLWSGESSLALAGGVNVLLLPNVTVGFGKGGFMSSQGRCKSFDASADGYVRSEGAGIVVLKPLTAALAAGDPIYAVIRGTAVNQDGFSQGMAAPNPQAQAAVLREAYRRAEISPAQVQYIEAHGTGTKLGDPIELTALGEVLSVGRKPNQPCAIGSVKTNIGHTETAAGVAGLIKAALAIKHQQIPPSLHFQQPNPQIPFEQFQFRVQTQLADWQPLKQMRIAGVNSFGFGGTNAHVVLSDIPATILRKQNRKLKSRLKEDAAPSDHAASHHLLTLSAKSNSALRELTQRYAAALSRPIKHFGDVCYAAQTQRTHFSHRLAIVADTAQAAREQLLEWQGVDRAMPRTEAGKSPVFLFTGQGSQALGMGQQLYQTCGLFRATLDRCDAILQPLIGQSILDIINQQPELLDQTCFTQPALFVIEYGLAKLWQHWGIQPAALIGHSIGEYVAACIAEVFSLEEALKLVAIRGQLMQALPTGGMLAIAAAPATVEAILAQIDQPLAIAAVNAPENVVISGSHVAIDRAMAEFTTHQIKTTPLKVSHPFHSPLMQPMLAEFRAAATEIEYQAPRLPIVSTVTGNWITEAIATPDYWCDQIRQTVRFAEGLAVLDQAGYQMFLEIGAKPILSSLGRTCLPQSDKYWLPSLRSGQPDWQVMFQSLGQLYMQGANPDWQAIHPHHDSSSRLPIHLPTYPFQRQRFWWEPDPVSVQPIASSPVVRSASNSPEPIQFDLSDEKLHYLHDHRILDRPVFPAAGYIEMLLIAAQQFQPSDQPLRIAQLQIDRPLLLRDPTLGTQKLQVKLDPAIDSDSLSVNSSVYKTEILSSNSDDKDTSTRHAIAQLLDTSQHRSAAVPASLNLAQLQSGLTAGSMADFYPQLRSQGLQYGPCFQAVQQIYHGPGKALGRIELPLSCPKRTDQRLHPVLLDASLHVLSAALPATSATFLPIGLDQLTCYATAPDVIWSYVELASDPTLPILKANLWLLDDRGNALTEIQGLQLKRTPRESLERLFADRSSVATNHLSPIQNHLYQLSWSVQNYDRSALPDQSSQIPPQRWLILSDRAGIAAKIAVALEAQGHLCNQIAYPENAAADFDFSATIQTYLKSQISSHQLPDQIIYGWGLSDDQIGDQTGDQTDDQNSIAPTELLSAIARHSHPLLTLVQTLAAHGSPRLWILTQGAQALGPLPLQPFQLQQTPLWGLDRVIRLEYPRWRCTAIDLDPRQPQESIDRLLQDLLTADSAHEEDQIAYRQGNRYGARLVPLRDGAIDSHIDIHTNSNTAHISHAVSDQDTDTMIEPVSEQLMIPDAEAFQLKIADYGRLDRLTLAATTRSAPAAGEVEIQVRAAGVNFRDVLNALGLLRPYLEAMGITDPTAIPFGWECAGLITAVGEGVHEFQVGDAVIAAAAIGSLGQFVTVPALFVVPKPVEISFAAAATIPTTFLTAYYGLYTLGKIQAGDRVLIHAAAGGVGLAAVQLAQLAGAEVYATASPSKWEFLRSIGVQHCFNSRTLEFADQLAELTQGQGVDLVLNSLNGDFIPKSLQSLATDGCLIELGKVGIWSAEQVQQVRPDVDYCGFDLLEISQQQPQLLQALLQEVMLLFQQQQLRPLPYAQFNIQDAIPAFRYMAQAKHIGKVVLTVPSLTVSQPIVRSDSSYLITGGFGGLGLQVAQWLAEQGAGHLILAGRHLPADLTILDSLSQNSLSQNSLSQNRLSQNSLSQNSLRQCSTVEPIALDITNAAEVDRLLNDPARPPIRGIIHAAGLLDDALLPQQTPDRWAAVFAPKVAGAWNLHQFSQQLPLDFFVCFSSIASVIGSIGQANYAAANAFLDGLAHYRRQQGLPALTINWGAWSEVGMASRLKPIEQQRLTASGMQLIAPSQGIAALDWLIRRSTPQAIVLPVNRTIFQRHLHPAPAAGSASHPLLPLFSAWTDTCNAAIDSSNSLQSPVPTAQPMPDQSGSLNGLPNGTAPHQPPSEFRRQLETAIDRAQMLQTHIQTQLAKVLGFSSPDAIDPDENFADLGMDSLMAVEFRNRLESSLGQPIPQTLAFDYPTAAALSAHLATQLVALSDSSEQFPDAPQDASILLDAPQPVSLTSVPAIPIDCPIIPAAATPQSPVQSPQLGLSEPPALLDSNTEFDDLPPAYYEFAATPEYLNLAADLERVEELGNPFFEMHEGIARDTTLINGKELISYATYNYLGMSGDPTVSTAAKQAIDRYGTSVSASRVVAGERPIHRALEQEIAQFLQTPDCIVYVGGHATNMTTIGHLFGAKDLILYDALSHNSIREGCNLATATAIEFPHNDWETLEYLLQQNRRHYQKVLIAIEGIYSTDGDIAPLPEIVRLKQKYKTFLLVDEAHSIGVLGNSGRGISEHFGIPADQVDLWMGTLSKSFASCGGYIAGSRAIVQYLKYTAPGFVYSVGISPANTAAALSALQLLQTQPDRVARLQARSQFFLTLAQQQGFDTGMSRHSPVIPIIVGEPHKAVKLSRALLQRGINVQPMVYPSVPYHAARLRFFLTCLHSETQIQQTIQALKTEIPRIQ